MPQRPPKPPAPAATQTTAAGNQLFAKALAATRSPSGAPGPMSRQELAEAANAELARRGVRGLLTDKDIGRFIRGETRWPREHYRVALRTVLGITSDRDLGFYPNRRASGRTTISSGTGAGDDSSDPLVTDPVAWLPSAEASDEMNRRDLLATGGLVVAGATLSNQARAAQALAIAIMDSVDRLGAAVDHLYELIDHYSEVICRMTSLAVYDDLSGVRSAVGRLLTDSSSPARRRRDLVTAAGWLSNLLAIAASYLGDHASALVWCGDAKRRGQDVNNAELVGWADLTRAMIAYYQGRAHRSVLLAAQGQHVAPIGTAVHARLASQEMRAHAMLGNADGMARAQHHAATAIAKLPSDVPTSGTFSVALGHDPPYTATSLLLVGRFEQAASATRRVLDTVYPGGRSDRLTQTSNYARALLILGLAEAGRGNPAEAVDAGRRALSGAAPVWPTMVLAGNLDRVLAEAFPGVAEAADYHACYLEAVGRVPQLTASRTEDHE